MRRPAHSSGLTLVGKRVVDVKVSNALLPAQSALRQVSRSVLRNYLEKCASDAIRRSDPKVYDELMDAVFKFSQ